MDGEKQMIVVGYKLLGLGIIMIVVGIGSWLAFFLAVNFTFTWWKLLVLVIMATFTGLGGGCVLSYWIAKKTGNWFKSRADYDYYCVHCNDCLKVDGK